MGSSFFLDSGRFRGRNGGLVLKLNVTALFAGIGGLETGLHRSGHTTSLFCENDPEAVAVLANRFPKTPLSFDVRDTQGLISDIDRHSNLLTAGFPCTDLSQAGLMQGFDGSKSSLVWKVFDLLDHRPFPNVLFENVPNWRVLHGGRYLTEVVEALEARGYRWAYRTIDARAFGLPQRRLRVFLFATLEGDPRSVLFHGSETPSDEAFGLREAAHGFYWTEGNKGLGWGENCVPTLKGGSSIGIPASPAILLPNGRIITPDVRDGERLQGFTEDWTNIEAVLKAHGQRKFNQRKRWLLVGNAVNVDVATWIGQNLAKQRAWRQPDGVIIPPGSKWPAAAYNTGSSRHAAILSSWPVKKTPEPLAEFLQYEGQPLSLRASSGFYSRIMKSKLRISVQFKNAIARHIERMEKIEERRLLRAAE